MRTLILLTLLLTGCTTIVTQPQGQHYPVSAKHSIVNNTGFDLDVFLEGGLVQSDLKTGQVFPVPFGFFQDKIAVTVTAHDDQKRYVGTDSLVFYYGAPSIWTVGRLTRPTDY
jgi:hypothetical protein